MLEPRVVAGRIRLRRHEILGVSADDPGVGVGRVHGGAVVVTPPAAVRATGDPGQPPADREVVARQCRKRRSVDAAEDAHGTAGLPAAIHGQSGIEERPLGHPHVDVRHQGQRHRVQGDGPCVRIRPCGVLGRLPHEAQLGGVHPSGLHACVGAVAGIPAVWSDAAEGRERRGIRGRDERGRRRSGRTLGPRHDGNLLGGGHGREERRARGAIDGRDVANAAGVRGDPHRQRAVGREFGEREPNEDRPVILIGRREERVRREVQIVGRHVHVRKVEPQPAREAETLRREVVVPPPVGRHGAGVPDCQPNAAGVARGPAGLPVLQIPEEQSSRRILHHPLIAAESGAEREWRRGKEGERIDVRPRRAVVQRAGRVPVATLKQGRADAADARLVDVALRPEGASRKTRIAQEDRLVLRRYFIEVARRGRGHCGDRVLKSPGARGSDRMDVADRRRRWRRLVQPLTPRESLSKPAVRAKRIG